MIMLYLKTITTQPTRHERYPVAFGASLRARNGHVPDPMLVHCQLEVQVLP